MNVTCKPITADTDVGVFDRAQLLDICMGEAETACTLVQLFCDRLPNMLKSVGKCLVIRDELIESLNTLHNLKANAGNLSAKRLYRVAALLEKDLRQGLFDDAPARFADLQREAELFLKAVPAAFASRA